MLDDAKEIRTEIADVLKSVEFLSNQYESLKADLFEAYKQLKLQEGILDNAEQ